MSGNKRLLIMGSTILTIIFAVLSLFSGCATPAPAPAAKTASPAATPTATTPAKPWGGVEFLRIVGPTAGSTMGHTVWQIYMNYWNKIPGITTSKIPGGDNNLWDLEAGTVEVAHANQSRLVMWAQGKNLPAGKQTLKNAKYFWTQTLSTGDILVRADSKYRTLEDLKSAKIVGSLRTEGERMLPVLEAVGITPQNITQWGGTISHMDQDAAIDAFRDRTADVLLGGGSPSGMGSTFIALEKTIPLRLIPIPRDVLEKASQAHPEFAISKVDFTKDIKSQKESHITLGDFTIMTVRADLPNDLVYEMLKQMLDTDCLAQVRKIGSSQNIKWPENSQVGAGGLVKLGLLHPGAAKYYQDKGIAPKEEFVARSD